MAQEPHKQPTTGPVPGPGGSGRATSRLEPVPEGSLLLHVGVPKTGTTAIQNALEALAPRLAEHGVAMPSTPLRQARAALSVVGAVVGFGGASPMRYEQHHWLAALDRIGEAHGHSPRDRLFFSSEYLCEATTAQVDRIAGDLQPYRPQVVVTVRPLARILPSAWQQYLKSGLTLPYEDWLHAVLDTPRRKDVTPSFWRRHDHGAVVQRWADRLGADRVQVVVLDPDDRGLVYRAFGDLLGLPEGLLREVGGNLDNRSMTAAESEVFRHVNVVLREMALPWALYSHLVRYGAIRRAVRRGPAATADTALRTPTWALDAAAGLGRRHADRIAASGVHVLGDLGSLGRPVHAPPEPAGADAAEDAAAGAEVPVQVAVEALLGTIARAAEGNDWFAVEGDPRLDRRAGDPEEEDAPRIRDTTPVGQLTTGQLATVIRIRLERGVKRRWRTARLHRAGR